MSDLYFTTNHGPEIGDTWQYRDPADGRVLTRVVVEIDAKGRVWCSDPYEYRSPNARFLPYAHFVHHFTRAP